MDDTNDVSVLSEKINAVFEGDLAKVFCLSELVKSLEKLDGQYVTDVP